MALNDALLTIGAQAMANAATHLSLHSALPNAAGSNETAAARKAAGWAAAANGDFVIAAPLNFVGGAANGAVAYVGLWSQLAAGGNFWGFFAVTGDASFNSAGEYTLDSLSILGS